MKEVISLYQGFMDSKDHESLIFHLRANLMRNAYGVENSNLYDYTAHGTKHLLEKYMTTVSEAIRFVFNHAKVRMLYAYIHKILENIGNVICIHTSSSDNMHK
jgi:hypothetical protein